MRGAGYHAVRFMVSMKSSDPQYRTRENILKDPTGVEVALQDIVPRLSATPGSIDALVPAPVPTEKSMKSFSVCRKPEIGALEEAGIV